MNKRQDVFEINKDSDDKQPSSGSFSCDPDSYREDISAFGFTKEQEDEFLETLWHILCTMVDLGWGVESVQYFLPEIFEKAGQDSVNLVGDELKEK
jgi:hypothetical protein